MAGLRSAIFITVCVCAGCTGLPTAGDNGAPVPELSGVENPVLLAPGEPGPAAYAHLFETVLDVVDDRFEIDSANRYDGRIVTRPRTAPGVIQFWKPGSPDRRERLLASLQTIRHRAEVQISADIQGGYMVEVRVYKELLDTPRPLRSAAPSTFRESPTVERQFQVIDDGSRDGSWIPQGRDAGIEEAIIAELRRCQ